MDPVVAIERLRALDAEAAQFPHQGAITELTSWFGRGRSILRRSLGPEHHLSQQFALVKWPPPTYLPENFRRDVLRNLPAMRGVIDAAIADLEMLAGEAPVADESGVDAELWEHIAPEVSAEAWGKVASQTVIFTEDRIRKWAGRPPGEVGKDLAIAIFGGSGQFQMGQTPGENQGWQLYAQGVAQALRNVDAHRIQNRPDHKRYAMGLVGACSLLLTQMRYEHGNRFRDTSPATAEAIPDE